MGSVWRGTSLTCAFACFLSLSACGGGTEQARPPVTGTRQPASATKSPALHMKSPAAFKDMDVRFVQELYVYRKRAIKMADLTSSKPATSSVRQLATGMRSVQEQELIQLTNWLKSWNKPIPADEDKSRSVVPSATDLQHLRGLQDKAFDLQFLDLLAKNQRGTVVIATEEQEGGASGPVRQFASKVVGSGTAVIVNIESMRKHLNG
jgi:uncharacterized protein (DUF305 family)